MEGMDILSRSGTIAKTCVLLGNFRPTSKGEIILFYAAEIIFLSHTFFQRDSRSDRLSIFVERLSGEGAVPLTRGNPRDEMKTSVFPPVSREFYQDSICFLRKIRIGWNPSFSVSNALIDRKFVLGCWRIFSGLPRNANDYTLIYWKVSYSFVMLRHSTRIVEIPYLPLSWKTSNRGETNGSKNVSLIPN